MSEAYLASIDLVVPHDIRGVVVRSDWTIEVNGEQSRFYGPEDALVFAALARQPDTVMGTKEILAQMIEVHEGAVALGALELPIMIRREKNKMPAATTKAMFDRLLRSHLGPLSSSVFALNRTRPVAALLCTDTRTTRHGLTIIGQQSGANRALHTRHFEDQFSIREKQEAIQRAQKLATVRP